MSDDGGDDTDIEAAVQQFVDDAEDAYGEYDQGYADADAVLRLLRNHLDQLKNELD